jgi:hypothetical protein
MTEPPLSMTFHDWFHTDDFAGLTAEPRRQVYRNTAKQLALRAITGGRLAAQIPHGISAQRIFGAWLIADPAGIVTAHRGQHAGEDPWQLAEAIIQGSSGAVQVPVLNGYYRDRPDAFHDLVERYDSSTQALFGKHIEAVTASHVYGCMRIHPDPCFLALLKAAIDERCAQLILHDWLEEQSFPHAAELQSKRWNQGKWTFNQLLDLLSKPFASGRRSFTGRAV